jgi:CrcB protein
VEPWLRVAVLSVGGSLGVNARYWLGVWMSRWVSPQFPWATFAINVSGSFAIGFVTVALTHWLPHPHIRLLVVVGFLGGYTTFSTFAYDALTLWEGGAPARSLANMVGSVAAGFVAVGLGVALARGLVERGPKPAARIAAPAAAPQFPRPALSQSPSGREHPPAEGDGGERGPEGDELRSTP